MRIYRAFNERKDSDQNAVAKARELFLKLENGDPELVTLWAQFREWSLRDFGPAYDRLRVHFDAIQGESFYEDRMVDVVEDAVDKRVLSTNSEGSIVFPSQPVTDPTNGKTNERIMLDANGNPRAELIVKPNGGTVYLTRDIAAIQYRTQELGADNILYVIGKEQQAHCLVLFAMADQAGYAPLGGAEHVSFGHLNVDGRKMKSREGKVVLLNEMLDESIAAATAMIMDRKQARDDNSPLNEAELEIARKIGISALIFNDLRQDRQKDIEFNADVARSVEAGGSTYIQYTDSRLGSILEKVGEPEELADVPEALSDIEKLMLADISRLPIVIAEASRSHSPHKLATYLTNFCQSVNLFYRDIPVANASTQAEQNFRLHLVKAAKQVIRNTSDLLHLELPGRM